MKCLICNNDIKGLSIHLKKFHKIKLKDYYDKYLKKQNEGFCFRCGKETKWSGNINTGYYKYCSKSCVAKCEILKKKRISTAMKNYGVKNPHQSEEVKEKYKQTCLKKYGVENSFSSESIKKKIKETNLKKYGVENPSKSEDIKKKIKETNLKKYGIEYPYQSKEIQEKGKQTNLKKYGVEYSSQTKEFQEKRKQTHLKKYGVEYPLQNKEIQNKIKKTCLEKYGVDNIFKKYDVIQNNKKIKRKQCFENLKRFSYYVIPAFSLDEFNGEMSLNKWKCVKCGLIFDSIYGCGVMPKCPNCFNHKSLLEYEVEKFLKKNISNTFKKNSRLIIYPLELDFYDFDKKIAIEVNGLYWHGEKMLCNKNYHLHKTNLCKEKNIRLIHIFEDEWILKRKIVENRLKSIFGQIKRKIFARKCEVKEIEYQTKNKFLNKYHIQGNDTSKIFLGLYYKNRLVSVMTFSKLRLALGQKDQNINKWELTRFCSIFHFNIIGAAGKLLSYFIKKYQPKEIISYADRRWSIGGLYEKLGFKLDHISQPNYWYVQGIFRIHRFNFRKNILKEKLEIFDSNLSEWENMKNNGYDRIWDCGNLVYKIKF